MTRRLAVACLLIAGCNQDGFDDCTQVLAPASSPDQNHALIQTALGDARPGDRICFRRGTYRLADQLDLTQPGVELRGSLSGGTVFDFAGQQHGANGLSVLADGVTLDWLAIKNTAGDGVRISKSRGVVVRNVDVSWDAGSSPDNGGYAIYPTGCDQILVESCRVSGASDTGIYVGQSREIVVRDNDATGNVAGIEIENSTDAEVYGNYVHDNTAGILVFALPVLPQKSTARVNVHDNRVTGNNHASFSAPASILSLMPAGTGIAVIAADDTEVHHNFVADNQSIGLGLLSFLIVYDPRAQDPAYDPWAEGNWLHDNELHGNGVNPQGMAATLTGVLGVDQAEQVLWDGSVNPSGTGAANCIEPGTASFRNFDLDHGYRNPSTVAEPCAGRPQPIQPRFYPAPPLPPPSGFTPLPKLSDYGFFTGAPADQRPAPGVVPYDVIAPLFADGAGKLRFLSLPPGGQITVDAGGRFQFPDGSTLIKTFTTPGGSEPIETRLLLLRDGRWWTQTYVYDHQTDALRTVPGKTVALAGGEYRVPSSDQCKTCHLQGTEVLPLGPRLQQLDRPHDYGAGAENQLTHLAALGAFAQPLPSGPAFAPLADPMGTAPLETRARSYLEANCAHCHSAGGYASSTSLRLGISTAVGIDLGLCRNPNAAGPGAGSLVYDIVPGQPDQSVLIYRMRSTAPEAKMPPLPTTTADDAGAKLVADWISSLSGSCAAQ